MLCACMKFRFSAGTGRDPDGWLGKGWNLTPPIKESQT